MFPESSRGLNSVVLIFFVLILVVAAGIVFFSFSGRDDGASAPSVQPAQGNAPVSGNLPPAEDPSKAPLLATKECAGSCDDGNACTQDACNKFFGECDHTVITPCCGNNACDTGETCLSSVATDDNSKACKADCGDCVVVANKAPVDWCVAAPLSASLQPPYLTKTDARVSGSSATLVIDVSNPSESTAKDVEIELYPSAGFDLDAGSSKTATIGDIVKYDAKSVSWSFKKQTGAVGGQSNPTQIKLTYSLNGKSATICGSAVFGE